MTRLGIVDARVAVGRELYRARNALGLTRAAVAARLGTSVSELERAEGGRRRVPLEWLPTARELGAVVEHELAVKAASEIPKAGIRRRRL